MLHIKKIISAQAFPSNSDDRQLFRVIGSVDINGKGLAHEIVDIDPVILLDEGWMRTSLGSLFNPHPHMGLVAVTYILQGAIQPSDNINGTSSLLNEVGGVYYINAGRGIVHNESAHGSFPELHLLQLWINPGIYDELPPAYSKLIAPGHLPNVILADGVSLRIILGSMGAHHSPADVGWPVNYFHVTMNPNTSATIPVFNDACRGFVYNLRDNIVVNENPLAHRQILEFETTSSSSLFIENNGEHTAEFILVAGKPHNKSFSKLSCHGGSLVGRDDNTVKMAMEEFEKDRDNFGRG